MTDFHGYNADERLYRVQLQQTGDTTSIDNAIRIAENAAATTTTGVLREVLDNRINKLKTIRGEFIRSQHAITGEGRLRKKKNTRHRRRPHSHRRSQKHSHKRKTRRRRSRSR